MTTKPHHLIIYACIALTAMMTAGCSEKKGRNIGSTEVVLETSLGNITMRLYDDTPLHRDNFVRLCEQGYYDGLLWNRIATGSTIQCGDATLRADGYSTTADTSQLGYTIKPEILYPRHYHKAGAVGMARQPDDVNPGRESCATQFYIVTGKVYDRGTLLELRQMMNDADTTREFAPFTEQQKVSYTTRGGAPHLDDGYTVFGEVVEGMAVVEALGNIPTDLRERPLREVIIKHVRVSKDK